ncbi:MAG: hypothetical protein COB53_07575 [Elusimicrobia bacterium]|nr:MAG: hypothetical protein COB53_07575 [Elusimicrobiota bacterium]
MDLGFETIGNATLICHDRGPVLVTDPWTDGPAYFGAWNFSHTIPDEQRSHILDAKFVWLSHGHPDHMSAQSLRPLSEKTFLVPDHVGGRIKKSLEDKGLKVQVLEDRKWITLSDRIRVFCIADYNQDGVLLVDLDGTLVVNLNDASDRGWGRLLKKIIGGYKKSILMRLSGYGDADMIHCFDEAGILIPPVAAKKFLPGKQIQSMAERLGCRFFIPFSSMHVWQREDSVWVDPYVTTLEDYKKGFASDTCELMNPFQRYDAIKDRFEDINPPERPRKILPPSEFGDDWSEPLSQEDERKLEAYFKRFEHLSEAFDFIRFRVGGKEMEITFAQDKFKRGVTFEAPRSSLMKSVKWEIFDDMLIGNFMKTTMHGDPGIRPLYPDFTPYVAKYGDNGLARTRSELNAYFAEYRRRAPLEHLFHTIETAAVDRFRDFFPMDSGFYKFAKGAYRLVKGG